MSKILIETRLNSLKLNESHSPRKGCLGRMEGICADYANPTRNGRFYSRELWEHVFNDELIKESLESKTLIGELDHPEERFEPLAKEACVVMTDYKFDDDKQVVYGGFDILDTPTGRILKSLLDYGCVMGVSSRGQGDIDSNGSIESVVPETYDFACFDVVTTPAVATARQHVTESTKKQKVVSLNQSIIEQINNSTTAFELDTIQRVIESTELSNIAGIKSAIRNKRKSITEGKTISNKAVDELKEAKKQINDLTKQLNSQSTKTINELKESRATASNLSSQVLAYKHREEKLIETIETLQNKASIQKENLNKKRDQITTLNNSLKQSEETISNLRISIHESRNKLNTMTTNEKNLTSQLNESRSKISKLQDELSENDDKISELSESLSSVKATLDKEKTTSKSQLSESMRKTNESNNLLEQYKTSFIESVCQKYGLGNDALSSVTNAKSTPKEIEDSAKAIVEKLDRYAALPFSKSKPKAVKVLSENLKRAEVMDEELEQSKLFIEAASGLN